MANHQTREVHKTTSTTSNTDHNGEDVSDLAGELEHNDGGGDGVGDGARQSRRAHNGVAPCGEHQQTSSPDGSGRREARQL